MRAIPNPVNRTRLSLATAAVCASMALATPGLTVMTLAAPQRVMEYLDRGVVAVNQGDKAAISWRFLVSDAEGTAFNVYRNNQKLNDKPLTGATFFVDDKVDFSLATTYSVRPVVDGKEQENTAGSAFALPAGAKAQNYISIPLKQHDGYSPGDASVADLDGDGRYEIILHMNRGGKDNSQTGITSPPIIQAYKLDGTLMWEINLGKNIREGAHYTQFQVFDYDGDGRAELMCKTADGTTDALGNVIGDKNADYVERAVPAPRAGGAANAAPPQASGRINKGPEFITVFDGLTGKAMDTQPYWPARGLTTNDPSGEEMRQLWGDAYGNRGDRFLASTAFLDGVHASAIFSRGYYTRTFIAAWDYKDGKLVQRWRFDSEDPASIGSNTQTTDGRKAGRTSPYTGQGFHSMSVADVDGDGKDEIVFGSMVVDDNGVGLFSTGFGHGDALHVGDLDPTRPGLEVFGIQERFDDGGAHMYDARTGEILWKKPSKAAATDGGDRGEGPGRGVAFDIDPRHPGTESWTAGAGIEGLWDAKGNEIGTRKPNSCNFAVYWDGDPLRELLDKNRVSKWNWESETTDTIFTADGCTSINGTKSNPSVSADLFGDWREEIVLPTNDGRELRIFTTTIPTEYRLYTLMQDPQYRDAIAWQNTAYNQPPHTSFDMVTASKKMPKPDIKVMQPKASPVSAGRSR